MSNPEEMSDQPKPRKQDAATPTTGEQIRKMHENIQSNIEAARHTPEYAEEKASEPTGEWTVFKSYLTGEITAHPPNHSYVQIRVVDAAALAKLEPQGTRVLRGSTRVKEGKQ